MKILAALICGSVMAAEKMGYYGIKATNGHPYSLQISDIRAISTNAYAAALTDPFEKTDERMDRLRRSGLFGSPVTIQLRPRDLKVTPFPDVDKYLICTLATYDLTAPSFTIDLAEDVKYTRPGTFQNGFGAKFDGDTSRIESWGVEIMNARKLPSDALWTESGHSWEPGRLGFFIGKPEPEFVSALRTNNVSMVLSGIIPEFDHVTGTTNFYGATASDPHQLFSRAIYLPMNLLRLDLVTADGTKLFYSFTFKESSKTNSPSDKQKRKK